MKILKILLIILVSTQGFLFNQNIAFAEENVPAVIINEIFWSGSSLSKADEFIELHNTTDEDVDISHWSIKDAAASGGDLILPASSTIPALGFFIIANYPASNEKSILNIEADHASSSISLANSDAQYELRDQEGRNIDSADDGSGAPFSGDNEINASMARVPGCWDGGLEECWFTTSIQKNLKNDIADLATPGTENGWIEPIINLPPTAVINGPATSEINIEINFDALSSFDPEGNELSYFWQIDDIGFATSEIFTISFEEPATHELKLTVNDGELDNTTSTQIIVMPKPTLPYIPKINDMIINEFVSYPEGENEWIEILNTTSQTIELSKWSLWDGRAKIAELDDEIASNEYLIVSLPSAKLNNSGDQIILKFGELKINHITYGDWEDEDVSDNAPNPGQSHALARTPGANNYKITITPTPGKENIITPIPEPEPEPETPAETSTPPQTETVSEPEIKTIENKNTLQTFPVGAILINEFVSDPPSGAVEWIEIYNPGNKTIDLSSGWKITDEKGGATMLDKPIKSKEYILIFSPKGKLNNDQDTISILDPSNKLIDSITYGYELPSPPRGTSLARDETNDWQITHEPTPGGKNTITNPKSDEDGPLKEGAEEETDKKSEKSSAKNSNSQKETAFVVTNFNEMDSWQEKQNITITGIVTVLPGVLGSQFFYIGDAQGHGMQVYNYKKEFPELEMEQKIIVQGELSKVSDTWRVKTKTTNDIIITGEENLSPTSLSTNAINEEFYGGFIALQGEVTEFKNSYLYLDDGAGEIKIAFGKSKALQNIKLVPGNQVAATGILVTTKSGYHLETRLPSDIQILNQILPATEEKSAERGYSNWAGLIPLAILLLIGIANIKKLKKLIPNK